LQLKNNAGLGLKRYDIDKDVIQLYFDEVRLLLLGLLPLCLFLDSESLLIGMSTRMKTVFFSVLYHVACSQLL